MFGEQDKDWQDAGTDGEESSVESTENYELLAWVKASQRRQDLLEELREGPENTTYFKNQWGVSSADVPRRYINDLVDRELVQCLTPDRDRYRLYGLTEKGEKMVELL